MSALLRMSWRSPLLWVLLLLAAAPAPANAQFGRFLKAKVKKEAEKEAAKKAVEAVAGKPAPVETGALPAPVDSTAPPAVAAPPASVAAAPAPVAVDTAAALWVNYDFIPGDRVLFYTDYSEDKVGNFPERLEFKEGNMEVVELGGRRLVRASSTSTLVIPLPAVLPQRFTVEIDVINRPSLDGWAFELQGGAVHKRDRTTSSITWGSDGAGLIGGGGGEVQITNDDANRARYRGKPAQLRILGDGKYIKVYLDERRLVNVPNANFEHAKALNLVIQGRSQENPIYVGRIRVAESRTSIYDDLAAKGHVSTQGIFFDTGNDQLRPESGPTLKEIASMLQQHSELRLRIEGHTDNVGDKAANLALSDRRAASVKSVLVRDYQVDAARLESKGLGDTKPVAKNTTPEGRQNNRRVELVKI
jgi:OmpA-OmpF porin, OOP family